VLVLPFRVFGLTARSNGVSALDRPLVGLTARPEFLTRCGIALIG
jgi:hypothetical protein